jgi:hypothetical protein
MKQLLNRLPESRWYHVAYGVLIFVVLPQATYHAVREVKFSIAVVLVFLAAAQAAWAVKTLYDIYKPKKEED